MSRLRIAAIIATAAVHAAACTETIVENLRPTVQVNFAPPDGTTAHGAGALAVNVFDVGNYADDAAMSALAARAQLKTWPERTVVPTANRVEATAVPANTKQVVLVPDSALPLDDRWYAIETTDLPRVFDVTIHARLHMGLVGARFRPGSHPRLARALFCDKGATGRLIYLDLSEPATLDVAGVQMAQGGQPVECTPGVAEVSRAALNCPGLDLTKPAQLSIAGGTGATGAPFEAGSWSIDIPALPTGDCPIFVAPIE